MFLFWIQKRFLRRLRVQLKDPGGIKGLPKREGIVGRGQDRKGLHAIRPVGEAQNSGHEDGGLLRLLPGHSKTMDHGMLL